MPEGTRRRVHRNQWHNRCECEHRWMMNECEVASACTYWLCAQSPSSGVQQRNATSNHMYTQQAPSPLSVRSKERLLSIKQHVRIFFRDFELPHLHILLIAATSLAQASR